MWFSKTLFCSSISAASKYVEDYIKNGKFCTYPYVGWDPCIDSVDRNHSI